MELEEIRQTNIYNILFCYGHRQQKSGQPCVKQGCRTARDRGSELTFFGLRLRTACDRRPSVDRARLIKPNLSHTKWGESIAIINPSWIIYMCYFDRVYLFGTLYFFK